MPDLLALAESHRGCLRLVSIPPEHQLHHRCGTCPNCIIDGLVREMERRMGKLLAIVGKDGQHEIPFDAAAGLQVVNLLLDIRDERDELRAKLEAAVVALVQSRADVALLREEYRRAKARAEAAEAQLTDLNERALETERKLKAAEADVARLRDLWRLQRDRESGAAHLSAEAMRALVDEALGDAAQEADGQEP